MNYTKYIHNGCCHDTKAQLPNLIIFLVYNQAKKNIFLCVTNTLDFLNIMAVIIDERTRAELQQYELRGVAITENELGRGSYAVVLEVIYQGLKCAGKKLHEVLYETGIGHAARRYLEECRLLSQTRHPNIVQFLGVCFEEGSQFPILVMEFLPTNLTSCHHRYGILPEEISYSILYDVSLGLAYLHGQTPPIIHRDLSGNNVLLSTNMAAKISDLGVAKMLNLTPLQQMTETPGTQAYMPPEVMVADPHYDVGVDEFSFGALMIHVFTAEWPAPKLGQTRVDPSNPHAVVAVTEVERREDFFHKIGPGHHLVDLIRRCLSNNPSLRPHSPEIVERMSDLVSHYPASFENRVEMLHRISASEFEKRELQQEVERKVAVIQEKERENEEIVQEREACVLACTAEVQQLQLEIASRVSSTDLDIQHLQLQLANKKSVISSKEAQNSKLTDQLKSSREEVDSLQQQIDLLQQQVAGQKAILSVQESELIEKAATCDQNRAEIIELTSNLSSTKEALDKKEVIIDGLNSQLTRTRDFLTSKSKVMRM